MNFFQKLFLFLIISAAILLPSFSSAVDINGVEYNNIRGWAWSDNAGWISFSCHSSEGKDSACTNPWGTHIVMPAESGDIGIRENSVIGHAWSDTLGWISFQKSETGEPPTTGNVPFDSKFSGKDYVARFDANENIIIGWARVLSACKSVPCAELLDPKWDGWIQFLNAEYGVKISNDGRISGYAWGGDVIGWLTFDVQDANKQAYLGVPVDSLPSVVSPQASISLTQSFVSIDEKTFALQVNVDGSASDAGGAGYTMSSYFWDWGDGSISTDAVASHTYNQEGNYMVTLTVTNNEGTTDSSFQKVVFTSPNTSACMFPCADDTQCNYAEGNVCFIPTGATIGYCMAGPTQEPEQKKPVNPTVLQSPTPYDCSISDISDDVLSRCAPVLEKCPESGKCLFNGVSCTPDKLECPSSAPSFYSCGINTSGPFCMGDQGVFSCLYGPGKVQSGRVGEYVGTTAPAKPEMPKGVLAEGQACTKPTADAPNNCEGINGCLYYNYEANGYSKDLLSDLTDPDNPKGDGIPDGVANCTSKTIETLIPATGCVYYANGLVNCLPSGSYAGLPEKCLVTETAKGPIVDCSEKTEFDNGGGCVFFSDGTVDCTSKGSIGEPYSGCVYEPNPKGAVKCPGIKEEVKEDPGFVQCSLTKESLASFSDAVLPCGGDGSCPNPDQTCINGSCYLSCNPDLGESCAIGQECFSPCPDGQYWDFSINQCVDSNWLALPDCQGAYLKDANGDKLNVYQNLPVGITSILMGLSTTEKANCKYSKDPKDVFDSPSMDLFSTTGDLIHETLVAGLFPLPDVNRYLVRCEKVDTVSETPACKISIGVGKECSSDKDCKQGQFCNPETNYCEIPDCLGASPSSSTVLASGTDEVVISMGTTKTSICKYDADILKTDSYANMSGIFNTSDNLAHTKGVSGLVEGYNAYYVRCQDLTASIKTGEKEISNLCKISFEVAPGNSCKRKEDCLKNQICNPNDICECSPGTKFNVDTGNCDPIDCFQNTDCEGNLQCEISTNQCKCPPGQTPDPITGECNVCLNPEGCDQCPLGTKYNPITNLCEAINPCQEGLVWNAESQSCVPPEAPNVCNVLGIKFTGTAPGTGIGPSQNCSIVAVILALLNWFAWLITVVAVVYGLRGGYLYITSAGNETKLEEARRSIIYTMVGVIVAILSFSIIAITRSITGL